MFSASCGEGIALYNDVERKQLPSRITSRADKRYVGLSTKWNRCGAREACQLGIAVPLQKILRPDKSKGVLTTPLLRTVDGAHVKVDSFRP